MLPASKCDQSWYSWSDFYHKTIVYENMLFIVASRHWFYPLLWFLINQMPSFLRGGYLWIYVCLHFSLRLIFLFLLQSDFNTCVLFTVRLIQRNSSNPHNSGYLKDMRMNVFFVEKCIMSTISKHTVLQRCLEILKPMSKTIPPLWFYKTRQKPIGKSVNALKL